MTRVEPAPPSNPRPATRFRLPIPRFSLGRLIKLAVLVGIVWVLVQIARTGVWTIPLVSALAYEAPAPVRSITAATPAPTELLARIPEALASKTLHVSEAELSALAEAGNQRLHLGLANVQTAILGERIELSFLMPQRNNAIVRLDLVPTITAGGDPDFTVQRTRLGTLDVPEWIIGEPARRLLQVQLQPAFSALPAIDDVRMAEGALAYRLSSS